LPDEIFALDIPCLSILLVLVLPPAQQQKYADGFANDLHGIVYDLVGTYPYRLGYYATGEVFADDPDFSSWLAAYDGSLSEDELLNAPNAHLDAWRAWADHFYPQLTDGAVQDLADREGNEAAFQRVNKEPAVVTSYMDTFDGRGQGFYLYRIRTIDAAGNLRDYSATFPPVHIFNVTPPARL
jgi:hypothetical protein